MNLEERFLACKSFLTPWLDFLELEVLKQYPNPLPPSIEKWVEALTDASIEDLVALVNDRQSSVDEPGLSEFLNEIKTLTEIRSTNCDALPLPKKLQRRVDRKKQHELEVMRSLADEFHDISHIVDIGGGAGHLSATLVEGCKRKAFCLDRSETFQKQGQERLKQWDTENFEKVEFVLCDFHEHFKSDVLSDSNDRLVVGLHGCGDLTTNTIRYYKQSKASSLLSVGCCYQNLNGQYNISKLGNSKGVEFSKNALHLAARCHVYYGLEDMKRKFLVRNYRYALHFFLFNQKSQGFKSIGKTSLRDYELSFSEYAHKYGNLADICADDLERFYESEETQRLIKKTIVGDLLRELLGRVVETYIVLDRALYLSELGHSVDVVEAFDRKLSPRNLLIRSKKQ